MSPAEAARTLDAARTLASGRGHLRLVSSIDTPTADGAGQILQQYRLEQGLSTHQIASALKLKPEQVAAIESMDFSKLPGLGYALGYVKAYVELMNAAEGHLIVDQFRAAWEPEQIQREAKKFTFSNQYAAPIGMVLAIGVVVWLCVFVLLHTVPRADTQVIAPPDAQIKAWANKEPAPVIQANPDIRPLSTLKALQDVRITLRGEDGALVTDRILHKGEEIPTDGLGRWFVSAPYGGALEAQGYGQTAIVGEIGQPVTNWRVPNFPQLAAQEAKALADQAAAARTEGETAPALQAR
ncbi:MAG: hypothetical protein RL186_502 [Pseudomonadota bacterium]